MKFLSEGAERERTLLSGGETRERNQRRAASLSALRTHMDNPLVLKHQVCVGNMTEGAPWPEGWVKVYRLQSGETFFRNLQLI